MSAPFDPVKDAAKTEAIPYWAEQVFFIGSFRRKRSLHTPKIPMPSRHAFRKAFHYEATCRHFNIPEETLTYEEEPDEDEEDELGEGETEEGETHEDDTEMAKTMDQFLETTVFSSRTEKLVEMSYILLAELLHPTDLAFPYCTTTRCADMLTLNRIELIRSLRQVLMRYINAYGHDELFSETSGESAEKSTDDGAKTDILSLSINELFPQWEKEHFVKEDAYVIRKNSLLYVAILAYNRWITMKLKATNLRAVEEESLKSAKKSFNEITTWLRYPMYKQTIPSISSDHFFDPPPNRNYDGKSEKMAAFVDAMKVPHMECFLWPSSWWNQPKGKLPILAFGNLRLNKQAIRHAWPQNCRIMNDNEWGLPLETEGQLRKKFGLTVGRGANRTKFDKKAKDQFSLGVVNWLSKGEPWTKEPDSPAPEGNQYKYQTGPEDIIERRLAKLEEGPPLKAFIREGKKTVDDVCKEMDKVFTDRRVPEKYRNPIKEMMEADLQQYVPVGTAGLAGPALASGPAAP